MKGPDRDTGWIMRRVTRRALFLGSAQFAVAGTLAWRMRNMQVDQTDQFRLLADENRINIRLIPPERGVIRDRNGTPLALNEQNYRIIIVREDAGDVAEVLDRLTRLIDLPERAIARTLEETARHPPFVPITVADRLSWRDISRVAANAPALPGVTHESALSRVYPAGPDFAHVIGYVGPVSEADLERREVPDPVLQIPDFQIGRIGAERHFEDTLRGTAGSRRVEVNAVGRVMRELDRRDGEAGGDVTLTIDADLQSYTQARMGAESAATVAMDVHSGEILASVSSPSFDPNLFVRGISSADYAALNDGRLRPMSNKTVQGTYPPGSCFKMVTALAALEAGEIDDEERVFCPGHRDISGRRFHCWRRGGHGRVNLVSALSESCDIYFYELAERVGIDRLNAMAARFGFGERFDLPMSSVAAGLNPTREWKRANRGEGWQVGDTINASIGQGFVLSTPLQLAVMTARLASGRKVAPRLLKARDGVEAEIATPDRLDISDRWLRKIREGMDAANNHSRGTARSVRVVLDELRMAGKTGTSQVRNISPDERATGVLSSEDLPWERRNHALFVGYGPTAAPRIAVATIVEHGGSGAQAAAPIVRDVLLHALHGGMPPLEAYPEPQRNRIETQQEDLARMLTLRRRAASG